MIVEEPEDAGEGQTAAERDEAEQEEAGKYHQAMDYASASLSVLIIVYGSLCRQ